MPYNYLSVAVRNTLHLLLLCCIPFGSLLAQEVTQDRNFIRVDQFGYMPGATKVAIIAKAEEGYNAGSGISLDAGAEVELINAATGEVAYAAYPKLWNGGSVDDLSGDRGAWFDFTEIATEGTYRIRVTKQDGTTAESYEFRIAEDVYYEVMRAAVNFFYYQRFNQEKTAEHGSGAPWTDAAWFDRPDQEYAVKQLDNPSVTRDLHGGWFDAGDPNKYVTFAVDAVHALLTTYDNAPAFWQNFDLNIPESDNDTPDLLDEIKFEIDWIKRMQPYDASMETAGIIQKMGILNDHAYISPPSTDRRARWYNGICVNSTITGAGMLAHAAVTYRNAGVWPEEVTELTDRAVKAFAYYEQSPNKSERCDDGRIEAGDADGPGDQYSTEHRALATTAAVYLFDLTGEQKYRDFIAANYREARPWKAEDWGVYRANQGEALMNYTRNPDADPTTVQGILNMRSSAAKSEGGNYVVREEDNLYRADIIYFNWGSNSLISRQAADIMDLYLYDIKPENHAAYTERGQSIINYLHGTNPSGICMLSNMYQYGGDVCADEMWHSWFGFNTPFDNVDGNNIGPAPGFITGGPNPQGQSNMPIKLGTHTFDAQAGQQPAQKAFSVDNFWMNGPWAYNEPAIYYQAAYVKALSYLVAGNTADGQTGGGISAVNDCVETEMNFTVANDVGSNGAVELDSNSPGSAGGASIKLFDTGDAAAINFEVPRRRNFDLALRVRVGEAAGASDNLVEQYELTLDGEPIEYVFDANSVSVLRGDTYWGDIVIIDEQLDPGAHTLTVTAKADYLKVDRLCYRDPNSVSNPGNGGGGAVEVACLELESIFMVDNEAGSNSAIRVDNFTPGARGGSYINMFDRGDRVRYNFTVTEPGDHELRFRVRVGESAGTDRNLADKYLIIVDGQSMTAELDETTISDLFGDTYWGDIVVRMDDLAAGSHEVTVEADRDWLKFDQFCYGNSETNSLFSAPQTIAAGIELSPNPSQGQLRLTLNYQDPNTDLQVGLYDLTGRQLTQQPFRLGSGATHTLNLNYTDLHLASGVYFLRLTAGPLGIGKVQRIVIQ